MKPIGIIANPASGKDIRRMVAFGSVFDNHEKVNIVRRVLLGLDSMGIMEVLFMPDHFRIGPRALEDLEVSLKASSLKIPMEGTQEDSTRAAEMLREGGAGCIITLGGDGTNRAVAKACGDTPLLPISTGTNNVFSSMVEGTMAGMAAAILALELFPVESIVAQAPIMRILKNGEFVDSALVDVVVSSAVFLGSRAVWEVDSLKEIFLTRAEPGNIGFSSIGGHLCAQEPGSGRGVHIAIGDGNTMVRAPIAPGLVRDVPVKSWRLFEPGIEMPVSFKPAALALDGEREYLIKKEDNWSIRLDLKGPRVVDIPKALKRASLESFFLQKHP